MTKEWEPREEYLNFETALEVDETEYYDVIVESDEIERSTMTNVGGFPMREIGENLEWTVDGDMKESMIVIVRALREAVEQLTKMKGVTHREQREPALELVACEMARTKNHEESQYNFERGRSPRTPVERRGARDLNETIDEVRPQKCSLFQVHEYDE